MKLRPTTWPAADLFDLRLSVPPTDPQCAPLLLALHHRAMWHGTTVLAESRTNSRQP